MDKDILRKCNALFLHIQPEVKEDTQLKITSILSEIDDIIETHNVDAFWKKTVKGNTVILAKSKKI